MMSSVQRPLSGQLLPSPCVSTSPSMRHLFPCLPRRRCSHHPFLVLATCQDSRLASRQPAEQPGSRPPPCRPSNLDRVWSRRSSPYTSRSRCSSCLSKQQHWQQLGQHRDGGGLAPASAPPASTGWEDECRPVSASGRPTSGLAAYRLISTSAAACSACASWRSHGDGQDVRAEDDFPRSAFGASAHLRAAGGGHAQATTAVPTVAYRTMSGDLCRSAHTAPGIRKSTCF